MRASAVGGTDSNVVDVYNGVTGAWSTAQLSVARIYLAAASVGNVALFAGAFFVQKRGGVLLWCACFCFARAAVLMVCLPCDRFFSHARHCRC
jgi:hypothetical protein